MKRSSILRNELSQEMAIVESRRCSGGEKFRKQGEGVRFGGFIDLAHAFDEAALVYGSDLIQHNLP